jgi:hypothetical protein
MHTVRHALFLLALAGAPLLFAQDSNAQGPNAFVGSFTMELHTYKGYEEKAESPLVLLYSSTADKVLTQDVKARQGATMLYDLDAHKQYVLGVDSTGKRTAVVSELPKLPPTKEERNAPDVQISEEARTIDGHPCLKLVSTTEDGTWTGWMAQDISVPYTAMMRLVQRPGQHYHSEALTGMYGFPLEYEWVSKDTQDRVVCRITELKQGEVDEEPFSLEGCKIVAQ